MISRKSIVNLILILVLLTLLAGCVSKKTISQDEFDGLNKCQLDTDCTVGQINVGKDIDSPPPKCFTKAVINAAGPDRLFESQEGNKYLACLCNLTTNSCETEFSDEINCRKLGGIWGESNRPVKECYNIPTKDFNKTCTDSSQCDGACLAVTEYIGSCGGEKNTCVNESKCYDKDAIDLGKSCTNDSECTEFCRMGYNFTLPGRCSAYTPVRGCQPIVYNGMTNFICTE